MLFIGAKGVITLPLLVYDKAIQEFDYHAACVIAVVNVGLSLGLFSSIGSPPGRLEAERPCWCGLDPAVGCLGHRGAAARRDLRSAAWPSSRGQPGRQWNGAHVSSALRERDPAKALDRLALMAAGVGGVTKIGECLAAFNRMHAKRVIHSRTCVMILSDGYDTGSPELVSSAMRDLRRRCKRIVWLNPLTGRNGFEPNARGMHAALPYLDLFVPAHGLESLAALEPYLARI